MSQILVHQLVKLQLEFDLEITFFEVTAHDFHLILRTPKETLDRIMYFLMKNSTRIIQKRTNRINHIYKGRYKSSLIHNLKEHTAIYSYLSLLPMKYEISSHRKRLKISDKELGLSSMELAPLEAKSIQCGLKKTQFSFKKNRSNRPIVPAWF
jgi:hypothetical protein